MELETPGIAKALVERAKTGKPIRIGLIGCGEMGTDIVTQVARMDGLNVAAVADMHPQRVGAAAQIAYGDDDRVSICESESALTKAIEANQIAACGDALTVATNPLVDVIVDATGKPGVGAEIGVAAMQNGKHLVMMNVEADVTVGAYLKSVARQHNVVYTLGAGDEPSSCMELIEFASALGLTIVSAGKGKNNPLNFDAVPADYEEEAKARNMNPRMLVEFVDGSKTMVEMTAIANATGLVPDKAGMHGPSATRDELADVLIPQDAGGVLSAPGRVDFSIGKGVAPGIFVVVEADHPRIRERLTDLKVGKGRYFTLHRPYHLTSLEVPLSCARAVLWGKADMVPLDTPVADVCALAKRDLLPGEILGAIGETDYRGWNMVIGEAKAKGAVPCGLAEMATVKAPIKKGELLTYDNIEPDADSPIVRLRKLQDEMTS